MDKNNPIPNAGRLVNEAWNLYAKNWRALGTIAAIPALVCIVAQIMIATEDFRAIFVGLLIFLVSVVLYILMQIALINAARRYRNDGNVTVDAKSEYGQSLKIFWPYIWISVLNILIGVGFVAALLIPVSIFGSAVVLVSRSVGSVFGLLLTFVLPIGALFVTMYTSMSIYSLIIDGKKGIESLSESIRLIRGRFWSVCWRLVVIGVVTILINLVAVGLEMLVASIFNLNIQSPILVVVCGIFSVVIAMISYPLLLIYIHDLYRSLQSTAINFSKPLVGGGWIRTIAWLGGVLTILCLLSIFIVGMITLCRAAFVNNDFDQDSVSFERDYGFLSSGHRDQFRWMSPK